MSHIPPLDPNVAARKGFRESEERLKRFWKAVDVARGEGGWSVTLDGRTVGPSWLYLVSGGIAFVAAIAGSRLWLRVWRAELAEGPK